MSIEPPMAIMASFIISAKEMFMNLSRKDSMFNRYRIRQKETTETNGDFVAVVFLCMLTYPAN
jgi:hypothetical protein